jgi:hypothetical protein
MLGINQLPVVQRLLGVAPRLHAQPLKLESDRIASTGVSFRHRLEASLFNLGKSRNSSSDLTSLNLEVPAEAAADRQAPATKPQAPTSADPRIQAEINRRTFELVKSGKHPEAILFLVHPGTRHPILVRAAQITSKPVLLFSSAALARFFMQERNLAAEMMLVEYDQVSRMAEDFRALLIDCFVMDLHPNDARFRVYSPTDKLITREQILSSWAFSRSLRNFNARQLLRPIFASPDFASPEIQKKLRQSLELIRAIGGYEVPFLHWLIALIAGMQHDELGRLEATADLEAFGPEFVGRTLPIESYEDPAGWFKSWSHAQLGLMTEFEMLNGPDGKPLESVLRVVNVRQGLPPSDIG